MNIENYLPDINNLDLKTKKNLKSKIIKQHKAIEVYDYDIEDYNYYYVVGVKRSFSKLFGFDYNLVGMD